MFRDASLKAIFVWLGIGLVFWTVFLSRALYPKDWAWHVPWSTAAFILVLLHLGGLVLLLVSSAVAGFSTWLRQRMWDR